jgi:hypothetical protein
MQLWLDRVKDHPVGRRGEKLVILLDSCGSGHWVHKLESGAVDGVHWREKENLNVGIEAACLPHECSFDGFFTHTFMAKQLPGKHTLMGKDGKQKDAKKFSWKEFYESTRCARSTHAHDCVEAIILDASICFVFYRLEAEKDGCGSEGGCIQHPQFYTTWGKKDVSASIVNVGSQQIRFFRLPPHHVAEQKIWIDELGRYVNAFEYFKGGKSHSLRIPGVLRALAVVQKPS